MRTHHSAFSGSVRRNSLVCASVITSPLRLPLLRSTVQSHFHLPIITRSATWRLSSSRFQYRAELPIRMIMPVASWLSTSYTSRPLDTSANCLSSTTGQQLRPFMASCCNPMVQLVSQVFPPSSENASSQCGLLSSFLQR